MKRLMAGLFLMILPLASPAQADPPFWGKGERGQANPFASQFSPGQAREAVREGRTVPLSTIFRNLRETHGGYQLGAELYSREDGTTFYEIDWMTQDGRKAHFRVDAESGRVIAAPVE